MMSDAGIIFDWTPLPAAIDVSLVSSEFRAEFISYTSK
jgi:hypothetical protein